MPATAASAETIIPAVSPTRGGARPGAGRKPKTDQNDAYTRLAKAKADHEEHKAKLAEIEVKKQTGELIEANRVGEIWRKHVETAKGRLLALPGSLAGDLFRAKSVADVELRLRDALLAVMEEIANAGLD